MRKDIAVAKLWRLLPFLPHLMLIRCSVMCTIWNPKTVVLNTAKAYDGKQVWTTVRPNHNGGTNSCGTGHFDAYGRISKEPELNAQDLALKTCRQSKNMVKNMVNEIAVHVVPGISKPELNAQDLIALKTCR
ncbi:hypothetical protein IV203_018323 [Nitzschia inconspicua]|uniref:Uncharacterized protein n=1 Tax=Nitzschia inconspicua TaxID=303405 RepID=A0A9K3M2L4_9STRA|nr:hypothetical protein IV203_018323 [Nitzschia inconspicua]